MGFSEFTSAILTCAGYQNVVIKLCLHEERHCHTRHPLNESTCWHLIDDTLCGAGRGEKGTFKPEGGVEWVMRNSSSYTSVPFVGMQILFCRSKPATGCSINSRVPLKSTWRL